MPKVCSKAVTLSLSKGGNGVKQLQGTGFRVIENLVVLYEPFTFTGANEYLKSSVQRYVRVYGAYKRVGGQAMTAGRLSTYKQKNKVTNKTNHDILTVFEIYKDAVFVVDADLRFWQSFLKLSIDKYKNENSLPNEVFSAIFPAYNINPITNAGLLKIHKKVISINTLDLDKHSKDFFAWVANLSILKTYNALEIFLLQAVHLRYFPNQKDPIDSKKGVEQINKEIKTYLKTQSINTETKNNRHIIQFLKQQSTDITSFLKLPIRIDLTTNWENFFELVSILRNVIAHQGTIVGADTHNDIKSKAKDIFQRHFVLPKDHNDYINLYPIADQFLNFTSLYNDFAVNTVKLMYNENDLTIFKMT